MVHKLTWLVLVRATPCLCLPLMVHKLTWLVLVRATPCLCVYLILTCTPRSSFLFAQGGGWTKGIDEGSGRVYYFNRDTQESSWTWPPPSPDEILQASTVVEASTTPLPVTAKGRSGKPGKPNALFKLCRSAISSRAAPMDIVEMRRLIAQGANTRYRDEHGKTSLMCASTGGQLEAVRVLLQADPKEVHVRMITNGGWSSLMLASKWGHTGVVRVLLQADPSPEHANMINNDGTTAMAWALNDDIKALLKAVGGT